MMKKLCKKSMSILLCIAMIVTMFASVSAAPRPEPTLVKLSHQAEATAVASFTENGFQPARAIDGNATTRWSNDHQQNKTDGWIYVDLGDIYTVKKIVLNWEVAHATEYKIQVSDTPTNADSWVDIYHTTTGAGDVETIEGEIPKRTNARAVRMRGIVPANNYGYSLYEFEVWGYEVQPPESLASGLADSAYDASSAKADAKLAFDTDDETAWKTTGANQWVSVDLGDVFIFDKFVAQWGANYASKYNIQISENGTEWTDVAQQNSNTATAAHDDTFDVMEDAPEGRYVRMMCFESQNASGYELLEFEMYGDIRPPDPAPTWERNTEVTISALTENSATFSWPQASDNKEVTGYEVYVGKELITQVGSSGTRMATVNNLGKGKTYSIKIVALDADGNRTPLNRTFTTIGNKPTKAISYDYPRTYKSNLNNNDWSNALLGGNGKLGIMVFGNPLEETVIFNDKYFWEARSESTPLRTVNTITKEQVDEIRNLLIAGQYVEANDKAGDASGWQDGGERNKHAGYKMSINMPENGEVVNYSRSTDYETGEISVNWTDDRGDWERTAFVSRPDDITVQRLTSPDGNDFDCEIELGVDTGMGNVTNYARTYGSDNDNINIRMKYPGARFNAGYEGVTRIVTDGQKNIVNGKATITGAKYVVLLSRTERYNGTYDGGTMTAEQEWNQKKIQADLAAIEANYDQLLQRNIDVHGEIFNRVKMDFDASDIDRAKSNEELLAMQKTPTTPVPALLERLFYAGRYHMLSSSGDKQTPDLLGNWTGDTSAGWGGYYHLDANLNLQISGGNIGDMPEAMEGFFYMMEQWQEDFRYNADTLLGGNRGMVTAGNTPITDGIISSIGRSYPYQYVTGGVSWLLYPMWEHYLITGDEEFLRTKYYPLVRDMGDFYDDFLVEKDENGDWIFAGSISPENVPRGLRPLSINSVYDIAGAQFALETLIETCKVVGAEVPSGAAGWTNADVGRWQGIIDDLPPYLINDDGAMSEWAWEGLRNLDDYGHRHSSQMIPFWYRQITKEDDPTIFAAAQETLRRKTQSGYGGHGHGVLHGSLSATSLNNAAAVNQNLVKLMKNNYYYSSLGTSHDPNYGASYCTDVANSFPTIVMEMLAETDRGRLELLPALPEALTKGTTTGMKGRGQITLDEITWDMEEGTISATITSDIDQKLTLFERAGIDTIIVSAGEAKIENSEYGKIARDITLKKGVTTTFDITLQPEERENLALNKPAEASSQSNAEQGPEKAFDGDEKTRWGGDSESPEWIQVDLEGKYAIDNIVINWEGSYSENYKLQVSMDGETWTDVYTKTGLDHAGEVYHQVDATGQYVRMYVESGLGVVQGGNRWGISIYEMQVYGKKLPNIALNKPAEASSSAKRDDQQPFAAVDGDEGSRWASESLDNQWIYIDLQDNYDIVGAKINWEDSYGKRHKLQVADKNPEIEESWKDVYTYYVDNDCPGKTINYDFTATGRYIRMQGLQRANNFGFSIWEFEVYGVLSTAVETFETTFLLTPSDANVDVKDAEGVAYELVDGKVELPAGEYTYVASKDGYENGEGSFAITDEAKTIIIVLEKTEEPPEPVEAVWVKDDNGWKYQLADGTFLTNDWQKTDGLWYYIGEDGYLKTGWVLDGGKWYFLDRNTGSLKTGWIQDGKWYYLGADGAMATGWLNDGGDWYYLDETNGTIVTGWVQDGADWYFMDYATGIMATDEWIGGYWVGPEGKWDPAAQR